MWLEDKTAAKAKSRQTRKSSKERQAWKTSGKQGQPKTEFRGMKGDKLGKQGGSAKLATIGRFWKISLLLRSELLAEFDSVWCFEVALTDESTGYVFGSTAQLHQLCQSQGAWFFGSGRKLLVRLHTSGWVLPFLPYSPIEEIEDESEKDFLIRLRSVRWNFQIVKMLKDTDAWLKDVEGRDFYGRIWVDMAFRQDGTFFETRVLCAYAIWRLLYLPLPMVASAVEVGSKHFTYISLSGTRSIL